MNWAKKLLQPKDAESVLPSHDCPLCGNRLRDEGGRLVCDQCRRPEQEDVFSIPACNCPLHDETDDGTAHCENCEYQRDGVCDYPGDDEDGESSGLTCDYCGRNVDPDANWTLETRDGTERFCCAECRDERAAEIEAAPLCDFCHQKCTQGEVSAAADDSHVFCSTECLEQYLKATAHDVVGRVCACCGKAIDGPSYISPRYPKLKFCSRQCHDDYLSKHLNPFNS